MRRLIILSIIFCFGLNINAQAQVTGYMGKRFTLSYNAYMAPNVNDVLNLNDQSGGKIPFRLYTKHMFEADYVIGRRVSVGLDLGFMRHKVPVYYENIYEVSPDGWYRSNQVLSNAEVNGFAAGVNFKFFGPFSKNTLAPLGSYLVLSAQSLSYNLSDEFGGSLDNGVPDSTKRNVTARNSGGMMSIGFGTRRIYYDKLTLDFSMTSGIAIVLPKEESHVGAGNFVTEHALSRHFLMYKIGVGGLLF